MENNVGLHEYDINTDVAYYKRWIENIMVRGTSSCVAKLSVCAVKMTSNKLELENKQ